MLTVSLERMKTGVKAPLVQTEAGNYERTPSPLLKTTSVPSSYMCLYSHTGVAQCTHVALVIQGKNPQPQYLGGHTV